MNKLVELRRQIESIIQSQEHFSIDFDNAWEWIGYSTKQKGFEALKSNFEENYDFCLTKRLSKTGKGGHNIKKYFLTTDCFKAFCMMAGTKKGKEIRLYFLKVEEAWNNPEAVKIRARQMGIIPPQAMVPQIEGGMNKATITGNHSLMDALWFYSIGMISRADLIRFRFGAAVDPSAEELEIDPLSLSWTMQISAMRELYAMKDDKFPLSRAKLEALIRGKPSSGMLIRRCSYETPYEADSLYSREAVLILAKRYFEIYESEFEKQEFERFPPVKAAYEQLKSNYQYNKPGNTTPIYLWTNKSHEQIAELRYLFETGVYNRDRIKEELFENVSAQNLSLSISGENCILHDK